MAVTNFSPLLGLALPTTGDLSGTWGTVVNDSVTGLIDSAVAGTTTLSSDADVTLSTTNGAANQARNAVILWTASGSTTRYITAPAQSKAYVVINATGGTQSIVLRAGGPTTGITVVAGEKCLAAWNGSDFVKVATSTADGVTSVNVSGGTTGLTASGGPITSSGTITLAGTLAVANGGTGVTTSTGTGSVVLSTGPSITLDNATGLPISTGVSGLGVNVATFLSTPSSANLAAAVTGETGSGALVFGTSPTLTTPNLGTPSAATLTNATGLPISTGVSGLGTGVATFLSTPSSANLAAAVTNETGSGSLVFATSPTLVTPNLGTPSAATLTNATGLPISTGVAGLGTGVATFLSTPSSANLAATVTDETGTGSLVFGTSPLLNTPALAGETFSTSAAVTAGTNAQGQGALTADYNVITTAASNPSGVTLPTATTGRRIVVVNKGVNSVNVYPAAGGVIDALSSNTAIALPSGTMMAFNASSTSQWYSSYNLYTSATASAGVTSFSAGTTGLSPSGATSGAITLSGTLALGNGGTGANLSNPGADRILFWDDSAGSATWLSAGSGLAISGTTISATGSGGTVTSVGLSGGSTGITVSGSPITSSGTMTLGGTLAVANGGTGVTTSTGSGSVVLSTGPTLVSPNLGTVATANLLNAVGLPIDAGTTGTLPVARGGTGATTLTGIVKASGTSAFTAVAAPTGALVGTTDTQTLTNKTITNLIFDGSYTEEVYTLGTSGSIALNPANGTVQTCALTGNPTFTDSLSSGQSVVLMLTNGASYTVTWPTITWATSGGNTAPTLTAADSLVFWKISTTLYGAYVGSYA